MSSKIILIIAEPGDAHALVVAERLKKAHSQKSIIWDSSRFPATDKLSYHITPCSNQNHIILSRSSFGDLSTSEIGAVWWRRPHPPRIPKDIVEPHMRAYCRYEASAFFSGVLESLDIPIFNNPHNEDRGDMKVFQLKCAKEAGLNIPDTIITNNPEHVKDFYEKLNGRLIFKMIAPLPGPAVSTRRLKPEHLENLKLLANAPVLFQEEIPPRTDIRVTVVGENIFAGESSSQSLDWRTDSGLHWRKHELPEAIGKRILKLMSLLGLQFGSLDFRIAPNDDYVFLEVNPNGQFLFLEIDDRRLQISRAFADFLVSAAKR